MRKTRVNAGFFCFVLLGSCRWAVERGLPLIIDGSGIKAVVDNPQLVQVGCLFIIYLLFDRFVNKYGKQYGGACFSQGLYLEWGLPYNDLTVVRKKRETCTSEKPCLVPRPYFSTCMAQLWPEQSDMARHLTYTAVFTTASCMDDAKGSSVAEWPMA